MGFHTSPTVAFLMTVFNLRLGAWFPNPAHDPVSGPGPQFSGAALLRELFGIATESGHFVNLSDGGHFENLGIYELVRRRCQVIIAGDAECDPEMTFGSLGNVIRLCETDFGAKITLDVSAIRKGEKGLSAAHCAVGTILYNDGSEGYLIYLKSSLTGDEDTPVREYKDSHITFPHETTGDQFFTDSQFESYRMLGYAVCRRAFRDCERVARGANDVTDPTLRESARQMLKIWARSKA